MFTTGAQKGAYTHDLLERGKTDLCRFMMRATAKKQGRSASSENLQQKRLEQGNDHSSSRLHRHYNNKQYASHHGHYSDDIQRGIRRAETCPLALRRMLNRSPPPMDSWNTESSSNRNEIFTMPNPCISRSSAGSSSRTLEQSLSRSQTSRKAILDSFRALRTESSTSFHCSGRPFIHSNHQLRQNALSVMMDEQQGASKTQALQVEGTIGEDEMEMCYAFFKMNDSDDDKMEEVTPILVNSATTTHSFSSLFAMGDKQEQDLLVDDFEPIRFVYEQEQQCRAW